MEIFLLCWLVAMWVVRAAQNTAYALQGKPPVQVQKEAARAALRGEEPRTDPADKRYGFGDYFKDLGHEAAESAREKRELGKERRRENREFKEKQRLDKQRTKQSNKLGVPVIEPDNPSATPDSPTSAALDDAVENEYSDQAPEGLPYETAQRPAESGSSGSDWKAGAPELPGHLRKPTMDYTPSDWRDYYWHMAERHRYFSQYSPWPDERDESRERARQYEARFRAAGSESPAIDDRAISTRPPLSLGDDPPRMATVTPIRTNNTEGESVMPETTEITGLQSGITHCQTMKDWFTAAQATREADDAHLTDMESQVRDCATSSEQSIAALTQGGVKGAAITALSQAGEHAGVAAQRYAAARDEIAAAAESLQQAQQAYANAEESLRNTNQGVAEQYQANPDAGDREFVTAD